MEESQRQKIINPTSMVDLKAELFRKQEEFKTQKLQNANFIKGRVTEKKTTVWSKTNAGVLERAQRDFEAKSEEENSLEKSRKALAAKAKLYEKMTQGNDVPEEDGSKIFLVDFQKKAIDTILDKRDRERGANCVLTTSVSEQVSESDNPEEQWVEYTDSLGRARTCMKKDLPELIKRDKALSGNRAPIKGDKPELLSEDMRRELERQQWEREEDEALDKPAGPIHYADVQHNEVRNHGVGFYQFSKEEGQREEELERLNSLRKQTVDQRARREQMKEKRKAMLDSRLAKVKQRKMARDGGGVFSDVSLTEESKQEKEVKPELETPSKTHRETIPPSLESMIQSLRKDGEKPKPTIREWDVGKTEYLHFQWEKRKQNLEDEREPEFAPPSCYQDNEGSGGQSSKMTEKPKVKGKVYSKLDPEPPKVIVLTREEVQAQAQARNVSRQFTKIDHINVGSVEDIPLPQTCQNSGDPTKNQNLKSPVKVPENSSQMLQKEDDHQAYLGHTNSLSEVQPGNVTVPFFDTSVPPPVMDLSVPPPGYYPPNMEITPDPFETNNTPPQQSLYSSVTHPLATDSAPSSKDLPIILPKAQIVDTRYIKNKEAPVLHRACNSDTDIDVISAADAVVTNPVISAKPVKYNVSTASKD